MELIRRHFLPHACKSAPSYRNFIQQLYISFSGVGTAQKSGEIQSERSCSVQCAKGEASMHRLPLLVTPKGQYLCTDLQHMALQKEISLTKGFWKSQNFVELFSLDTTTFISSLKKRIRENLFSDIIACIRSQSMFNLGSIYSPYCFSWNNRKIILPTYLPQWHCTSCFTFIKFNHRTTTYF